MGGRRCSNGTVGGGGGVLAITCGGIRGGLTGGRARGSARELDSGDAARADPGLSAPGPALAATTGCGFRTGGVGTGFPGIAARGVGFTGGCGVTCALSSCCGGTLTAW
jgi:hypothetical protein